MKITLLEAAVVELAPTDCKELEKATEQQPEIDSGSALIQTFREILS